MSSQKVTKIGTLNRPGLLGGSKPSKGWSHADPQRQYRPELKGQRCSWCSRPERPIRRISAAISRIAGRLGCDEESLHHGAFAMPSANRATRLGVLRLMRLAASVISQPAPSEVCIGVEASGSERPPRSLRNRARKLSECRVRAPRMHRIPGSCAGVFAWCSRQDPSTSRRQRNQWRQRSPPGGSASPAQLPHPGWAKYVPTASGRRSGWSPDRR